MIFDFTIGIKKFDNGKISLFVFLIICAMQLRFVEIFCDVAEQRSFSKGAAAHEVSQSSASQAVHLLEKRLGTRLIDRSKRPLELTPAGQIYLDGCREVLERYRSLEDSVRRTEDRVEGVVHVAAIYSVGLMQMESYVKRFTERYPDAELRIEYLHPDKVYAQVRDDKADLGLVSFPRNGGEFVSLDWQEQPMVLVVPPEHRLAGRKSIPIAELEGEDYVGFTSELTIRREVERRLKKHKVHVNVVHEFDNIENIKRAIEIGSGVALLPDPTVRQEAAAGSLVTIPLSDVLFYRPLGIVHKRHKQLSHAAGKLIELLQKDLAPRTSGTTRKQNGNGAARSTNGNGATHRNGSRRKKESRFQKVTKEK